MCFLFFFVFFCWYFQKLAQLWEKRTFCAFKGEGLDLQDPTKSQGLSHWKSHSSKLLVEVHVADSPPSSSPPVQPPTSSD